MKEYDIRYEGLIRIFAESEDKAFSIVKETAVGLDSAELSVNRVWDIKTGKEVSKWNY